MTDEEAIRTARNLLHELTDSRALDLCQWVLDIAKRLPKPRSDRNEYMRNYMRLKRAKEKLALQQHPSVLVEPTKSEVFTLVSKTDK